MKHVKKQKSKLNFPAYFFHKTYFFYAMQHTQSEGMQKSTHTVGWKSYPKMIN